MKVNLYDQGTQNMSGGYNLPGMTLTGPLTLSGTVKSGSEAVHKQYVDTAATNLNAANIVAGTIPTARMPALSGDVTTAIGTTNLTLNVSGVTAGDYTKATVDSKGRVTTGLSLVEADLPNLDWSKIATNKPNTLAGYGITDGVSSVNGVVTGNLTLKGDPTQANGAATKQYVDANVSSNSSFTSGDITAMVTNVTPSGFLRANGGQASKTLYSSLYAVMGDTFTGGNTTPGAGRPWAQQYDINTLAFSTYSCLQDAALYAALGASSVIVTKNRVYLLGGNNSSGSPINAVYTAAINSDGTLGAWTTSTSLPTSLASATVFTTKNRVYLVGGYNGSGYISNVYTAPINSDGTLGAWVSSTAFPVTTGWGSAIVTLNRVYILGALNAGGNTSNIYTAPINADGTIGAWTTTSTGLPGVCSFPAVAVTKNRVHVMGGYNGTSIASTVYTAPINSDGTLGTWTTGGSLPMPLDMSTVYVNKQQVLLFGGRDVNMNAVSTVMSATINADGTLGAWGVPSNIPMAVYNSNVIATSSKVFLLGGQTAVGANVVANVYTMANKGGLNDYSSYINGTIIATDPNNFKLPDYSQFEKTSSYFFIKT